MAPDRAVAVLHNAIAMTLEKGCLDRIGQAACKVFTIGLDGHSVDNQKELFILALVLLQGLFDSDDLAIDHHAVESLLQ